MNEYEVPLDGIRATLGKDGIIYVYFTGGFAGDGITGKLLLAKINPKKKNEFQPVGTEGLTEAVYG